MSDTGSDTAESHLQRKRTIRDSSDDDSSFTMGSKHRRSASRFELSTRSKPGYSADDPIQIISDDEPSHGSANEGLAAEAIESFITLTKHPVKLVWKVLRLTWGATVCGFSIESPHPMTVTLTSDVFEFKATNDSFPGICINLNDRLRPFQDIACNTFHSPCFIAFRPSGRDIPGLSATDTITHTATDHRYFVLFFENFDVCRAALVRDTMIKLSYKIEAVVHEIAPEELSRFDCFFPRPARGRTRAATQKTIEETSFAKRLEKTPVLQYPIHATTGNRITLTEDDLDVLDPGNFLNDSIVDLYLLFFKNRCHWERFHIFNSFFYKKYTIAGATPQAGQADCYRAVKNWTRNIDLFTKDFLIMPVCDKMHWSCVIACYPGMLKGTVSVDPDTRVFPCLLLFDSLGSHSGPKLFRVFRNYLTSEWNATHPKSSDSEEVDHFLVTKDNMPGYVVQVPQQTNDCDCGLFMLQYIEEFLLNPFSDFRKPQVHNPTWFDPEVVVRDKRESIRKILLELCDAWRASQQPGSDVPENKQVAFSADALNNQPPVDNENQSSDSNGRQQNAVSLEADQRSHICEHKDDTKPDSAGFEANQRFHGYQSPEANHHVFDTSNIKQEATASVQVVQRLNTDACACTR